MFQKQSTLLFVGVALAAFVVFLLFGGPHGKSSAPVLEQERSGDVKGPAAAGGNAAQGVGRAAGAARPGGATEKKPGGKPKPAPDPELVKKLVVPEKLLTASGPPESPRPGVVRQSFRGTGIVAGGAPVSRSPAAGRAGVGAAGGSGGKATDSQPTAETGSSDGGGKTCPNCDGPKVRTMIVDLQEIPLLQGAFEQTCSSTFVAGYGEQFQIQGDPACVVYFDGACRGSANALFDNRYWVTVTGECIPNREFLKAVIQR